MWSIIDILYENFKEDHINSIQGDFQEGFKIPVDFQDFQEL